MNGFQAVTPPASQYSRTNSKKRMNLHKPALLIPAALLLLAAAAQQPADLISIAVTHPGPAISPRMFGIFFEDINFAADGGLYPELVKNRSFEFTEPLMAGWSRSTDSPSTASWSIRTEGWPQPNNPHYLRVRSYTRRRASASSTPDSAAWASHAGPSTCSRPACAARRAVLGKLSARLTDERGQTLGEANAERVPRPNGSATSDARPPGTDRAARSSRSGRRERRRRHRHGVAVSRRRHGRTGPNGLRKDLVQLLADMKPGFIRFPGGCIVEGRRLALRYEWKKTVGDVGRAKALVNRWNDEFNHRPAPDYFQSFGLGFFEYFQLAEDIGAEPLPILNCGMACQFNSGRDGAARRSSIRSCRTRSILIEFANGPSTSRVGRAARRRWAIRRRST